VSVEPVLVGAVIAVLIGAAGLGWRALVWQRHADERFLLNLQADLLDVDTRPARSLRHLRSLVRSAQLARDLNVEPVPERRGPWRGQPGSWRLPQPAAPQVLPPVRTARDASHHLEAPAPEGHDLPPLDDPFALHDRAHAAGLADHRHETAGSIP
jgi:hypothetical protein